MIPEKLPIFGLPNLMKGKFLSRPNRFVGQIEYKGQIETAHIHDPGRLKELLIKGVDVLLTIDALSMAYQDLYDSALFLLGDRDFIPLIQAVKSTGKKTFGFFFTKKVAQELSTAFDFRLAFDEKIMNTWLKEK